MKDIIATLAAERDISADTIRKWRERGSVPHKERLPLVMMAKKRALALSAGDFEFRPKAKRKAKQKTMPVGR